MENSNNQESKKLFQQYIKRGIIRNFKYLFNTVEIVRLDWLIQALKSGVDADCNIKQGSDKNKN